MCVTDDLNFLSATPRTGGAAGQMADTLKVYGTATNPANT